MTVLLVSGLTPRYNDGTSLAAYFPGYERAVEDIVRCFDEVDREYVLTAVRSGQDQDLSLYCRSNRSGCTRGHNVVSLRFVSDEAIEATAGYFRSYGTQIESRPVTRRVHSVEELAEFERDYGRARTNRSGTVEAVCGFPAVVV